MSEQEQLQEFGEYQVAMWQALREIVRALPENGHKRHADLIVSNLGERMRRFREKANEEHRADQPKRELPAPSEDAG